MGEFNFDGLTVLRLPQGNSLTNAYRMVEADAGLAVVIDPVWDGRQLAGQADAADGEPPVSGLLTLQIDHLPGAAALDEVFEHRESVGLHPAAH